MDNGNNDYNGNVDNSAGFTMMESMVAIAITLVVAGVLGAIVSTAFKGANSAASSAEGARKLLYIDRLIRNKAEDLYVPYWASMERAGNDFTGELWASGIAKYIESIKLIYNSEKIIRGVEVRYSINNKTFTTFALFSNRPLLKE